MSGDDVARLELLTQRKRQLWNELVNCDDAEQRDQVFDKLDANREELARLKVALGVDAEGPRSGSQGAAEESVSPSSVGETLRAKLVIPADSVAPATPPAPQPRAESPSHVKSEQPVSEEPAGTSVTSKQADAEGADPAPVPPPAGVNPPIVREATPPAPESDPSRIPEDAPAAHAGSHQSAVAASAEPSLDSEEPASLEEQRRSAHERYEELERVRPRQTRSYSAFAIPVAIAAVALVGWLLFLRPSGSAATAEATTTTTTFIVVAEASAADQIRAALDGLGYGSVIIEEREGTIYLAGRLDSESDRSAAIDASQALARGMSLDSSALGVNPAPEPETSDEDQQPVAVPPVVEGPYIEATLDGKDFVLAGVVPSAALATDYLRAAEIAYSPYIRSELMVDEQVGSVDWLERGPEAIVLLPMIIDGKILIANDQVTVSGRSPDEAGVLVLQGALGQITGLPVVVGDLEVTNLLPPSWVIAADAGEVELGGFIPTEEIRDMLVEGAAAAYGADNVEDGMTVDPSVYPSLWMYSGGPLMQAMSTFPDYELRIDGTAFSGFINGGVTFESNSARFSGNYAQVLDVGVSVLTRDPSLQLVIEGHTDNRGTDEANLALSQARAEAVRDYFIANGIDGSRLTAIGIGEAQPVVSNDTEEGRARNRRIQYALTSNR